MSQTGDHTVHGPRRQCWDNSPSEAFFATLKREVVHRYTWVDRGIARRAVVRWIEGWYNPRRLHSSISYLSRIEMENSYHQTSRAA